MSYYTYIAKDANGKKVKGQQLANTQDELKTVLATKGLALQIANVYHPEKKSFNDKFEAWQGVPVVQKIFFTQNLGVMLRGGFSISRAMGTLALQTNHKYFRKVVLQLQSDVESGIQFSQALRKHPRVFSELFINMIAAGEASGKLDDVLKSLTIQMKKEHQLVGKVRGAMIYPLVVVFTMVIAAIAMMVFVVPRLMAVFGDSGVELPLPTRILIAMSDFVTKQWHIALSALIIVVVGFLLFKRTKKGTWIIDAMNLRMPIIGPIILKVNLARFTRNLSSMLATDIPIIDTFHIIGRTLGSAHYRASIEASSNALRSGQSISKVLEAYPRLYPPLVQQMISVGEESGTLDEVSGELATFYEEEVDQTMSNLSTILEPVLLLILGGGVAALALAIMLPIYNLSDAVGNQ